LLCNEGGLIGEADLLSLIPPSLGYAALRKSMQTLEVTYSHMSLQVVEWVGFENAMNSMAASLNNDPWYSKPSFRQYLDITDEEEVQQALSVNVLETLDVLGSRRNPSEKFGRHSAKKNITGELDFILYRCTTNKDVQ
jgi:hypothetical protein